ncbi:hypothetical protein E0H58_20465 [Kribbella speibonae]|uniref:Uncharacterized protein n=1 Tax=Kribbella speibonae TaxID=1572660 RepID=A0ABY2A348_9ACTN|nr:hypothetical protein E0H58_20465 [Kribbella speibonae]
MSTTEILDSFEGTQQIQALIVARRLLGKASAELKWPWLKGFLPFPDLRLEQYGTSVGRIEFRADLRPGP